jgi:ankyrin repeat protein
MKKRKQDTVDLEDRMTLFKRVRLVERKYINSKKTRPTISQTQHSSMLKRHRLFAWLDDNVSWEKAQDEKRQRKLSSYLLQTESFLQLAALNGDKDAVQNLLSQGEDVNGVNTLLSDSRYSKSRCTALHAAVEGEHKDLAEYLLAMGADPNSNLDHWGTPLVLAARKHNTEIAETLLHHGADVDKISIYQTINALQRASYDGNLDMVILLLKYGANTNSPSGHFGPPLVAAAMNDNVELIERLLDAQKSAHVNSMHYYDQNHHSDYRRQQSALTRAISYNHKTVVEKLLDRGADIGAECECGNAVQNAAYFGREEILDDLIQRGGDIYRSTQSFANALEAAVAGAEERMFHKLIGLGMDIHVRCTNLDNLLQVAARSGEDRILIYLLDHGMDVNLQGGVYVTALIAAARHGNSSTCRILIERGADLFVHRGDRGCALHAAVEFSHIETVEVLLDAGAHINTIGGPYGTVLQLAALNTSERLFTSCSTAAPMSTLMRAILAMHYKHGAM